LLDDYFIIKLDGFVKSQKCPFSLEGRGLGEGEYSIISSTYVSLSFILSRQGRENPTFCETIKFME